MSGTGRTVPVDDGPLGRVGVQRVRGRTVFVSGPSFSVKSSGSLCRVPSPTGPGLPFGGAPQRLTVPGVRWGHQIDKVFLGYHSPIPDLSPGWGRPLCRPDKFSDP